MPTPDMKPYAERLAKAMPERFLFEEDDCEWWRLFDRERHSILHKGASPMLTHDFLLDLQVDFRVNLRWERSSGLTAFETIFRDICQEAEIMAKAIEPDVLADLHNDAPTIENAEDKKETINGLN